MLEAVIIFDTENSLNTVLQLTLGSIKKILSGKLVFEH
jgi:hypothetical protein